MRVAVVVLAGGAARRWGGRDKTAAPLAGRTLLEHAVEGLRAGVLAVAAVHGDPDPEGPDGEEPAVPVVVAGPSDHAARPRLTGVRWVREDPPGAGPVAGLAAALSVLPGGVDVVVVGAGDAPFGGTAVPRLCAALAEEVDAAVGLDPSGRRQPLLAAYRLLALRTALDAVGDPAGAALRTVVERLRVTEVPVTGREALDLDTPAALEEAERELRRGAADVPGEVGAS